jgi:hypothetical protein
MEEGEFYDDIAHVQVEEDETYENEDDKPPKTPEKYYNHKTGDVSSLPSKKVNYYNAEKDKQRINTSDIQDEYTGLDESDRAIQPPYKTILRDQPLPCPPRQQLPSVDKGKTTSKFTQNKNWVD